MGTKVSLSAMPAALTLAILACACERNGEPPPSPIAPDIQEAVQAYFEAWEAEHFEEMYALTTEQGSAEDFVDDMRFAPVVPKNLSIRAAETLSTDRVRVEYSLDLPELKYIVAGLIIRNPARYGPSCVRLNEERTRYTSYEDFLLLEREDAGAPWKLDQADGNTLVNAVGIMTRGFLFTLYYRINFPDELWPPDFTDPTSPEFDSNAVISSLATYGVERDLELEDVADLGEPVASYFVDLAGECQ